MAVYLPNPNFYSDQIKDQEKLIKNLTKASYDSDKRGYVINGKVYTQKQIDATYAAINKKIATLKKEEKKYGKYGPDWGDSAKSNTAGVKYEKLRKAAQDIKVTDYASAVANLKAWKEVSNFVAANPDIKVATNVNAVIQGERGRNVNGVIAHTVSVDESWDGKNLEDSFELATKWAETGTTSINRVLTYGKEGASNSTYKNVKTVTNQELLDTRLSEIDSIVPTATTPTATTPTAESTVDPASAADFRMIEGFSPGKPKKEKEKLSTNKTLVENGPSKPGVVQGDTTTKGGVGYTWTGSNWVKAGAVPFNKIEATFRKMFPSQAWMLDLDRTKYPKLFELIQRGVSGRMYETQQGLERFGAELKNTDFYTELATTDKIRQIKAVTGDLGFEGSNFNKFLTTSMNMGWEGETLKAETYKEVFRKDDAGNYINKIAVERAKKSNAYLTVTNVGKAYFNTISDTTVESRLTGALNDEDIQRQQRELAKTKYGHLANLIDQGFTLADLSAGFKQQAAQLLEKDENAIDMSQADFEASYNYGEPGQKRMMTNGEWEIMLRSNAKFGWDKTNNAKQEARQLASSISQAFGKVI
jgi:hypothetical protein